MHNRPDVVFVGAGPVGLFTAIQAKLFEPSLNITLLEKYEVYKRAHTLLLDSSSFKDSHKDPAFRAIIDNFPSSIATNELEDVLLGFARKLGIIIQTNENIRDCAALAARFPDTKYFVGADGSHSIVHEQIFKKEYQIKTVMQYMVEVKYQVEGSTRPLGFIDKGAATTYGNHFGIEHVGHEKERKTQVAVRFFVNEATAEVMEPATFKNFYTLASGDKIPQSLMESINAWLKARETMVKEQRILGSERITCTNLPVYVSKDFVKEEHGRTWFLVGDAAFGVPYFRSLNNGIICSGQLANVLSALIGNHRLNINNPWLFSTGAKMLLPPRLYYSNYVRALALREWAVAGAKNVGVHSAQIGATVSQAIPVSRASLYSTEGGRAYMEEMGDDTSSSLSESSLALLPPSSSIASFFSSLTSSSSESSEDKREERRLQRK